MRARAHAPARHIIIILPSYEIDGSREEGRAVAVGEDEGERTVDDEVLVHGLPTVRTRGARGGKHGDRRPLDSPAVDFELGDVPHLFDIGAPVGEGEKGAAVLFQIGIAEEPLDTPMPRKISLTSPSNPASNAGKRQRVL